MGLVPGVIGVARSRRLVTRRMIQPGKVLAIGRVNLVRQVRDRGDLFFVFVLPTIIVVALGLQFGGPTQARLGVVAPTGDPAAEAIVAALSGSGSDVRGPAPPGRRRRRRRRGARDRSRPDS